ncbi:MAG: lipoyl synthase [Spirochaetales bacterium]|nr:lipoyl synthase [Spirochaetales bacterium]
MSEEYKLKKPPWLRMRLNTNENYRGLESLFKSQSVHTVCQEARCPNIHECWGKHKTASFMILGDICTRGCRFCAVKSGRPGKVDGLEPARVAEAVKAMGLSHVVITMVTRDDLSDGGVSLLADTVKNIHEKHPSCTVEVLSSDLMGQRKNIEALVQSRPEIIGHNLETVERLTPVVRSRSTYRRSLDFLKTIGELDSEAITKSALMLGLGETRDEVIQAMDDLREADVRLLNLGQYLQPSKIQRPVQKYWTPAEFQELKEIALNKGFDHCESGPLVRSSYHADEQYQVYRKKNVNLQPGT